MRFRNFTRLLVLIYLLAAAYFAFQPFRLVPGRTTEKPSGPLSAGGEALRLQPGFAVEGNRDIHQALNRVKEAGRMSLEILIQTDALDQPWRSCIVAYSCQSMNRNFTLGQNGNALAFQLRTTQTDWNITKPYLLVPRVLNETRPQHVVVTYDGSQLRLYVDGQLHPQTVELDGGFSNWGSDQLFVLGDDPAGGGAWKGTVHRFSIFDRALNAEEVLMLSKNKSVAGAVAGYRFESQQGISAALTRLNYRNLFIASDSPGFNSRDCLRNIIWFIPLAGLVYFARPTFMKHHKLVGVFILPLVFGLLVSGTIEFSQRYLAGRVPCIHDLAYNVLGTLLGCMLLWLFIGLQHRTGFNQRR